MNSELSQRRYKKRSCFDKVRKEYLDRKRRRQAHGLAQRAAFELLTLFTVLLALLLAHRSASDEGSASASANLKPGPTRIREPNQRREATAPESDLTYQQALQFIRRCASAPHRDIDPVRAKAALNAFKVAYPEAADWLKYCFDYGAWSEIVRCLNHDERDETRRKMESAAQRWALDRNPPLESNINLLSM